MPDVWRSLSFRRRRTALLLVDVINLFDFPRGAASGTARAWARQKHPPPARSRARSGVPVIYVNDNWGRWRSDFKAIVADCSRPGTSRRADRRAADADAARFLRAQAAPVGFSRDAARYAAAERRREHGRDRRVRRRQLRVLHRRRGAHARLQGRGAGRLLCVGV